MVYSDCSFFRFIGAYCCLGLLLIVTNDLRDSLDILVAMVIAWSIGDLIIVDVLGGEVFFEIYKVIEEVFVFLDEQSGYLPVGKHGSGSFGGAGEDAILGFDDGFIDGVDSKIYAN